MFDTKAFKLICGFLGLLILGFVVLLAASYFRTAI